MASITSPTSLKSEDQLPEAIDKCVADGIIKTGTGSIVGAALSLVLFKRRMWPITLGIGVGVGMALSNCQKNLNRKLIRTIRSQRYSLPSFQSVKQDLTPPASRKKILDTSVKGLKKEASTSQIQET